MTTSDYSSSTGDRASLGRHYLEAAVQTASPARLRLMLIERGIDVAGRLAARWRRGEDLGVNEDSLKLLDLLTELLSGVGRGGTEADQRVCRQVADLYVFLSQHLVAAETTSDVVSIDEIRIVLETEAVTWRSVCLQQASSQPSVVNASPPIPGRLNLEG